MPAIHKYIAYADNITTHPGCSMFLNISVKRYKAWVRGYTGNTQSIIFILYTKYKSEGVW